MKFNKVILLIFFFVLNIIICAQTITAGNIQQVTFDSQGAFYYPKFSPDGKRLYFSGENLIGIYYSGLNDHSIKKVNNAYGAGFGFSISNDSKKVYYKENKILNKKKLSSIIEQDISTGRIHYLVKERKDLSAPNLTYNGYCFYTESGRIRILSPQNKNLSDDQTKNLELIVFVQNKNLVLLKNGVSKILNPLGEGEYIWPSLSPDRKKILFTFAGDASYICNLDGIILVKLGWANAPRWSPDGRWIAFMDDRSDGFNFKSSDIGVISSDGKKKFILTPENDVIKLYPEWSPGGNKMVYHSLSGNIFLIDLKIDN